MGTNNQLAAARSPARRGFLRVRRELTPRLAPSRWQHEGGGDAGSGCGAAPRTFFVSWYKKKKRRMDGTALGSVCMRGTASQDCHHGRTQEKLLDIGAPGCSPLLAPVPCVLPVQRLRPHWGQLGGCFLELVARVHVSAWCPSPAAPPCTASRAQKLPSPYLHLLGHPMLHSWGTFLGVSHFS